VRANARERGGGGEKERERESEREGEVRREEGEERGSHFWGGLLFVFCFEKEAERKGGNDATCYRDEARNGHQA